MLDLVYLLAVAALAFVVALVGRGGRETVIVITLIAALLAAAAIGYLVVALVRPERF